MNLAGFFFIVFCVGLTGGSPLYASLTTLSSVATSSTFPEPNHHHFVMNRNLTTLLTNRTFAYMYLSFNDLSRTGSTGLVAVNQPDG
jgi:hypothetical protein